jgi:hypothetical protein
LSRQSDDTPAWLRLQDESFLLRDGSVRLVEQLLRPLSCEAQTWQACPSDRVGRRVDLSSESSSESHRLSNQYLVRYVPQEPSWAGMQVALRRPQVENCCLQFAPEDGQVDGTVRQNPAT